MIESKGNSIDMSRSVKKQPRGKQVKTLCGYRRCKERVMRELPLDVLVREGVHRVENRARRPACMSRQKPDGDQVSVTFRIQKNGL